MAKHLLSLFFAGTLVGCTTWHNSPNTTVPADKALAKCEYKAQKATESMSTDPNRSWNQMILTSECMGRQGYQKY